MTEPMLTCYRYGSKRALKEGLRIGAARHVPRGVRRQDWQRCNYFDVWLPLVAAASDLVADYRHEKIGFKVFSQRYRNQMKATESRQVVQLLGTMSLSQPISIGCYCEDEKRCHRSILRELIANEAKAVAGRLFAARPDAHGDDEEHYASPVCYAPTPE
jgi:uncharacterized protein YeaO (DUF488 family)